MSQLVLSFESSHSDTTLYVKDQQGQYHVAQDAHIFAEARAAADRHYTRGTTMDQPGTVKDYFIARLAGMEHEVFTVAFLDNQHRLIESREMSQGTINQASVYPREVVKAALQCNAAAIICAHNHPSGSNEPSTADISLTRRLKVALELVDVRLLDHIIVAGSTSTSLAERGQV